MECARKIVQNSGFKITKSFILVKDIGMKKIALHKDIGANPKELMKSISENDVRKA